MARFRSVTSRKTKTKPEADPAESAIGAALAFTQISEQLLETESASLLAFPPAST
jgi:hypothetical protein